jgi:hypothetical protein
VTALDSRPQSVADTPCGWSVAFMVQVLRAHSLEIARREADAYAYGYAAGLEAGRAQAEAEMDAWWAMLARRIRADADRRRGPMPEPAVRPQPDDAMWFTDAEWSAWAGAR